MHHRPYRRRPRLLDLFCCQGGGAAGYAAAGFDVTGVDIAPQPRYPYAFVQADALDYLRRYAHRFDAVHASCPCQGYSETQRLRGNAHPMLIEETRAALEETGLPWVMENVPGAPLRDPVTLCGAMFPGLRTYRHRLFEVGGWTLAAPEHPEHLHPVVKMGRPLREGEWYHAVGNFSNVPYVRRNMGVEWMSRDGIRECIPPAYTAWVGRVLLAALQAPQQLPLQGVPS